jgi:hypothetical protein
MRLLGYIGAIAAIAVPVGANAQSTADPARVVDELLACRSIAESGARLACMDRTAAAIADARDKKQIVVLDRDDVREAKRSVFGFSLPKIKLFGKGDDEPEVTEINGKVANVRDAGNGRLMIRLAEGTNWQTTETSLGFSPKPGDTIRIQAGILGSYKASIGKGRAVKIKRVL